ncbi:ABC transporter permease [Pyxidicoccus fallax]|uniref:ABC transporter permease n=1 Tax=Pyxidicoccus fallax TaxID=394095 RepID=A0A848L8R3_9BACT|nr:ABC transporter permease [Pyxidicoccus fallax]NMO14642.1 ABC transporter permease [Pyxidicoccus fallax]NPC79525.1 ABC transporter permease [Pyxidicoccus fallax]
MDRLMNDLKYGFRLLLASPTFTLVVILTVGLGIGASTAIFSVINSIWVQPLRFQGEDRLRMVWESAPKQGVDRLETSLATLADWKEQSDVFESLSGLVPESYNLAGTEQAERLHGMRVGAQLFRALGVDAVVGRAFGADEEQPAGQDVALLSHKLWQRRFGGAASTVGGTVTLDGKPYTVLGVMPPKFDFPPGTDVWVPLVPTTDELRERGNRQVRVVGRLKPGVTPEQADAALRVLAQRLAEQHPAVLEGRSIRMTTVREGYLGSAGPVLATLAGAVAFVLLIVCANVANLLLARAAVRRREMAVRAALGAGRGRLLTQLLTESVLLAVLGGALGVLLALWGTHLIAGAFPPSIAQLVPGWSDIHVDGRVLVFSLLLSLVTGLLFGLAPAVHGSKQDLTDTLKDGGRATTSKSRLRSTLVVAEVALALLLVVGAGLMIQSLYQLEGKSPGFRQDGVLTFELALPEAQAADPYAPARFYEQLLEQLSTNPDVTSAAAISLLPMSRNNHSSGIIISGKPVVSDSDKPMVNRRVVSPNYFRTLDIPLRQGRDFTTADTAQTRNVAIINEEMARKFWPGEEPLGQRFTMGGVEWEVIGVSGNVRTMNKGQLRDEVPEFYLPLAQSPQSSMGVLVRTRGEPLTVNNAVRQAVAQLDGNLPPPATRTLEQRIAETLGSRRLLTLLLGTFAALALLLAAGGVYGVMSYSVAQRTHELGVRQALGATESDVFKMVLGQALRLAGIGVTVGCLLGLVLMRLMKSLFFEVSPSDPLTFVGTALLLLFIALLASFVPALRATRVSPATALLG